MVCRCSTLGSNPQRPTITLYLYGINIKLKQYGGFKVDFVTSK
ncbi:unnamed protein product [Brassica rapa subsp. narinosa]